jgi:hypothetical protein
MGGQRTSGFSLPEQKTPHYAGFLRPALSSLSGAGSGYDVDDATAGATLDFETDHSIRLGKQRVVAAEADVFSRVIFCAALTDQDVSGDDLLAAELLEAQAL